MQQQEIIALFKNLQTYVEGAFEEITTKLEEMQQEINQLKKQQVLQQQQPKQNIRYDFSVVNTIKLPLEEGLNYLNDHKMERDLDLILRVYVKEVEQPSIRYISKNQYQYWSKEEWIEDNKGEFITRRLILCLVSYYRSLLNEPTIMKDHKLYISHSDYITYTVNGKAMKTYLGNELKKHIVKH